MTETLAGMAGGLGLFLAGMWLLTENLKTLANRRLRLITIRWSESRLAGVVLGMAVGATTQSMAALVFIIVGMLRAGFVSTRGALIIIIGGNLGVTLLVLAATLDVRPLLLFVLGASSIVMVLTGKSRYRSVALSFFCGAMVIFGLILLRESAAPLANWAWFAGMMESAEGSLLFALVAGALLTSLVQSSAAVSVFGIGLAVQGAITTDQTIMLIYGCCLGSGLVQWLLSTHLTGRSRRISMYQVVHNGLIGAVMVPLLYIELTFEIPLMKALVLSIDLGVSQQMAFVFILTELLMAQIMLVALGPLTRLLRKRWPATEVEDMSRARYIHHHALGDIETSLVLADLEQRRVLEAMPRYLDAVRRGTGPEALCEANRGLLSEIEGFLATLRGHHAMPDIEGLNSVLTRQKLLSWLEEQMAVLCEVLQAPPRGRDGDDLRASVLEGIEAAFLLLLEAIEVGDEDLWSSVEVAMGDRSELMRRFRDKRWTKEQSPSNEEVTRVIEITNAVEHVFFLLTKLVREFDTSPDSSTHVLMNKRARRK